MNKVLVKRRQKDYVAYSETNPEEFFGTGITQEAAIGDLFVKWGRHLGIQVVPYNDEGDNEPDAHMVPAQGKA